LAKNVARELGLTYLDTGAMYRALALKVLRQGVDLADDGVVRALVESTAIDLADRKGESAVLLDGEEVSHLIRTPEVSQMASKVSALPVVRRKMLELQRAMGRKGGVVAEGRDIGTVIFPDAEVKIFLYASVEERSRRRFEELRAAGRPVSFSETRRQMEERDQRDSERDLAPLQMAEGALAIDSSTLDAATVARRVIDEIRKRTLGN
jgi:cytidylate kinase